MNSMSETEDSMSAATENNFVQLCINHFMRTLNAQNLRVAENQFSLADVMDLPTFVGLLSTLMIAPSEIPVEHQDYIVRLSCVRLFDDLQVFHPGGVRWLKFIEYIICKSESLRKQGTELGGKDFFPSATIFHWKPANLKAYYTKAYYWEPIDTMVCFECGPDISLAGDRGIVVQRPCTQRRRFPLKGHTRDLLCAEYLPDPLNMVVTSGNDQVVNFYDAESFAIIRRWPNVTVSQLCWAQEINVLYASEHFGEKINAWRLPDAMTLRREFDVPKSDKHVEFPGHSQPVQCLRWIGHMRTLASCALDSTILLWDVIGQRSAKVMLNGHKKGITCMEYSYSNRILCSAGYESHILLWDPNAGTRIGQLEGHAINIVELVALPNSEIMSLDADCSIRRWDLRTLKCVQAFNANDGLPQGENVEPKSMARMGHRMFVSGKRIVVFDRDVPDSAHTTEIPVSHMLYCPRQKQIVIPHPPSSLRVWDVFQGSVHAVVPIDVKGSVTALSISLDARRVLVGSESGEMVVLNAGCLAQRLKTLTPHLGEVLQIVCMPDKIVSCATDKVILIHDDMELKASAIKIIPPAHLGLITRMSGNPERFLVGCTSPDGHVCCYGTAPVKLDGRENIVPAHESSCSCIEFIFRAPLMVTADVDGRIIFHSLKPLLPYDVFHQAIVGQEHSGLTCLLLGPEELSIAFAVEGSIICTDVSTIIEAAADLFREISAGGKRNCLTEVEREAFPKELPVLWTVQAHKGSIDSLLSCGMVLFSIGTDCLVRSWDWTGNSLGALSAGGGTWKIPPLPRCTPPPQIDKIVNVKSTTLEKSKARPLPKAHAKAQATSRSNMSRLSTRKTSVEPRSKPLDSGLKRAPRFDAACKTAADRLSNALAALDDQGLPDEFDKF